MRHSNDIGGKVNDDIFRYITFTSSVLMSYIITQSDYVKVKDISEVDVMVDEVSERTKLFSSREEAELSLMDEGIFPTGGVFPFNIRIQRIQ